MSAKKLQCLIFTRNFYYRSGEIDPRTLAHANAYFDKLFAKLEGWLIDHGYDPMKLPDVKKSFEYVNNLLRKYYCKYLVFDF